MVFVHDLSACVLWRRLDTPGHDACCLIRNPAGWQLEGTAVFQHEGTVAQLAYRVVCDLAWRTQHGHVRGWLGAGSVDLHIAQMSSGVWSIDGAELSHLADCVDLDFSFTPATNLLQLRRLELLEGQAADAPAAWLDVSAGTVQLLPQRYERRTEATYWYESPSVGYAALLDVAPTGFIRRYPGLWEAEAGSPGCP